jgi:hypothetical protein
LLATSEGTATAKTGGAIDIACRILNHAGKRTGAVSTTTGKGVKHG